MGVTGSSEGGSGNGYDSKQRTCGSLSRSLASPTREDKWVAFVRQVYHHITPSQTDR
jgi:hypothetical protein